MESSQNQDPSIHSVFSMSMEETHKLETSLGTSQILISKKFVLEIKADLKPGTLMGHLDIPHWALDHCAR